MSVDWRDRALEEQDRGKCQGLEVTEFVGVQMAKEPIGDRVDDGHDWEDFLELRSVEHRVIVGIDGWGDVPHQPEWRGLVIQERAEP